MFHDSFDDNQEEVLNAIYESFRKGAAHISPMNLSSTVTLFKELKRPEQAAQMIQHYLKSNNKDVKAFNLYNYPFEVKDPDVIMALKEKYAELKVEKTPLQRLEEMANVNGWSPEDIAVLADLSVDDYYKMLKSHSGTELSRIINTCLQFDRIMNASPEMLQITKRVREALLRIGKESSINALRVKRYGVDVGAPGNETNAQ